jgi:hypothetical protein
MRRWIACATGVEKQCNQQPRGQRFALYVFLLTAAWGSRMESGVCDDGIVWIENTAAVMRRIEHDTRTNFEKVRTWRGRFKYKSYTLYEGEQALRVTEWMPEEQRPSGSLVRVTSGHHDFAVDVPKSSFFCSSVQDNLPQFRELMTEEVVKCPGPPMETNGPPRPYLNITQPPYMSTEIVTPERTFLADGARLRYQIKESPDRAASARIRSRGLIVVTKSTEIRGWGGGFEPRKVFGYNQPIWMEMSGMAAAIESVPAEFLKETMAGISVEEVPNGDHVDLVYEKRPKGVRRRIVFGGAVGHCPTSYASYRRVEGSGSEPATEYLREIQTWDYVREGEAFLPKRVARRNTKADGTLQSEYSLTLGASELNVELGPDVFTYKQLGLNEGDCLYDETVQKLYKVSGDQLVEIFPTP